MRFDLTGQVFDRLTCVRKVGRDNQKRSLWLCNCECGNTTTVVHASLSGGNTKSCGCLQKDSMRKRLTEHSFSIDENGRTPRLYSIWRNMKQRCSNPNASRYKNYGGRGITVCNEWLDYINFHNWAMNNGYDHLLTLDRKDNNKGYEPANCRWATGKEQASNTSLNHFISYKGVTKTLKEWSVTLGLKSTTLSSRLLAYNWDVDKAFNVLVGKHENRIVHYKGRSQALTLWAAEVGISYKVLHKRIFTNGWSLEKAFNQPLRRRNV